MRNRVRAGKSATARQAERRARIAAEGGRGVTVLLDAGHAAALDRAKGAGGYASDAAAVIAAIISYDAALRRERRSKRLAAASPSKRARITSLSTRRPRSQSTPGA